MVGIELKQRVKPVLEALLQQEMLALPAGPTVIRLLPPLTISRIQPDTVARRLRKVLNVCVFVPRGT